MTTDTVTIPTPKKRTAPARWVKLITVATTVLGGISAGIGAALGESPTTPTDTVDARLVELIADQRALSTKVDVLRQTNDERLGRIESALDRIEHRP